MSGDLSFWEFAGVFVAVALVAAAVVFGAVLLDAWREKDRS